MEFSHEQKRASKEATDGLFNNYLGVFPIIAPPQLSGHITCSPTLIMVIIP